MPLFLDAEQLAHIARNGGGFEIEAGRFTPENLAHIARNLTEGVMIVSGAEKFTSEQLAHISRNGKGKVIFK